MLAGHKKKHFRKETLDKAHKLFEGEKDYR